MSEGDGFRHRDGHNRFLLDHPHTPIQIHGLGLGDRMIIWQIAKAFERLAGDGSVPEIGKVVMAVGGMEPAYRPEQGDVNLYWWWSFGAHDDEPELYLKGYLDRVTVEPDLVLCLSEACQKEAEQLGCETLYLPLASQAYRPLGLERSGCGYAGTPGHKGTEKADTILREALDRHDFEWVSGLVTPSQLNLWYNNLAFTLGMTREGQRSWGMVNNRVFEVLASGTPFILEEHPTVEDVLGFQYPYQAKNRREVAAHIQRFTTKPKETLDEFREFSKRVREEHTYTKRLTQLFDALT